MTSPWSDNEDLTAALMYARTTALITPLQAATAVSADVTTGIFTAVGGGSPVCTITAQRGRIEGGWAIVYCAYTVTAAAGTPISVPTDGNFANIAMLNIAAAYQSTMGFSTWGLQEAGIGRGADHVVSGTQILLAAVAGSANIATSDAFSFTGRYPLT